MTYVELSKTEELALLDSFIDGLPRSCYLRDILADGRGAIEQDIRSDVCCGTLASTLRARHQAQQDVISERKRVVAAQGELKALERKRELLESALRELRSDAKRIASMV